VTRAKLPLLYALGDWAVNLLNLQAFDLFLIDFKNGLRLEKNMRVGFSVCVCGAVLGCWIRHWCNLLERI
jgi:hypothetical protein